MGAGPTDRPRWCGRRCAKSGALRQWPSARAATGGPADHEHRATGVTTDVVEGMEVALKKRHAQGAADAACACCCTTRPRSDRASSTSSRVGDGQGGDVLTPREVYELVQREGFKVDYARLAITDEQAPVPAVFSRSSRSASSPPSRPDPHACSNCQMGEDARRQACDRIARVDGLHYASSSCRVRDMTARLCWLRRRRWTMRRDAGQCRGRGVWPAQGCA